MTRPAAGARRARTSRRAAKLVLAFMGTLIGLATLELGVRALHLAPEIAPIVVDHAYGSFESSANPILQYVPRPGSRDISAYGLRDRDYAFEPAPGTLRVVVLGDSIGFGFCTPDRALPPDQTFAKVLEARLAAAPPPGYTGAEVINLSVSGYDSVQEAEFLRVKGLAFEPDLVVVAYCLNDAQVSSFELQTLREHGDDGTADRLRAHALRGLFETSHLVRTLWYRLIAAREAPGEADGGADRRSEGFDHLRALSDDAGFETVVAIFPYLDGTLPYRHRAAHEQTAAASSARGFDVIDLLPAFLAASGGDLPTLRAGCIGMHPGPEGHRVAAIEIEGAIRARLATR